MHVSWKSVKWFNNWKEHTHTHARTHAKDTVTSKSRSFGKELGWTNIPRISNEPAKQYISLMLTLQSIFCFPFTTRGLFTEETCCFVPQNRSWLFSSITTDWQPSNEEKIQSARTIRSILFNGIKDLGLL